MSRVPVHYPFVDQHKDRLLEELFEFLEDSEHQHLPENKSDVERAAKFVATSLTDAGLENVKIIPTANHPLVYADWLHAPGKPTVLCYGHYDVQPPDPLELWNSPPFEPVLRDGNIYARGSADDKGQMYMHVKAVEALRAVHGTLPVNLKFLIEGEEEIGGESVAKYVAENPAKLKADVALVSDTALYAEGIPTLCIGLRGLVYTEIEAKGPSRDLHSGLYGGSAPNAVFGLVELLSKLKDANGRIQIPGMYDDVEAPAPAEKQRSWASLPFNESEYPEKEVGATSLTGEPGFTVLERVWARPTLRSPRHRRRIHRGRREDGDSRDGNGQGQHEVGAEAERRENHRGVQEVRPGKRAQREFDVEVRVLSAGVGDSMAESRSSGDRRRGQGFSRCAGPRDGVRAQRRLDPDCGRLRPPSPHPDHPDGIWPARRRLHRFQRKISNCRTTTQES